MFGLIGAYICFYYHSLWLKSKNIALVTGLLLLITGKLISLFTDTETTLYGTVFSFSLTSLSVLLLLPYLNALQNGSGFLFKLITYISLVSYSMYLLNLSVIQFWLLNPLHYLIDDAITLALVKFFGYWLLVIILSILMYKYIEQPFMKLRKNIEIK